MAAGDPLSLAPLYVTRPKRSRAKVGGRFQCGGGVAVYKPAVPAITIQSVSPALRTRRPAPRAVTGYGRTGGGVASPISTPLGSPSRPKPFIWRPLLQTRPRARLGPRSRTIGGGIAAPFPVFAVVTAYQRPSPQVRRPVSQLGQVGPLARAVGAGRSGVQTPLGAAATPKPFVFRSPAPARARCGPRGTVAAGVASHVVTPLGYPPQPAPRPVIVHLPPHRAKIGPGTFLAAGVASQIVTPLGFRQQPPPRPVFVHVPPARARLGLRGQAAGGVASAVSTPLGSPSQPAPRPVIQHLPPRRVLWRGVATRNYPSAVAALRTHPFIFRSPPAARARLGSNLACGDGLASQIVTPLGYPQPFISPIVFRSVIPARARIGRGVVAGGIAATAVTPPLGTPSRPKPFVFRSPAPARGRLGPRGLAASGIASAVATPLGSAPKPPPRPVIQHPPHRILWRGLATQNLPPVVTAYQRPPVQVKRPAPARAHLGPRGLPATGYASQIITPLGQIPPARKVPIFPPKTTRATAGRRTVGAGQIGLVNPSPYGTPARPYPFIFRSPAPARARTGARDALGAGIASRIVTPLGSTPPARKIPQFPPKITRAWTGHNPVAGGVRGLTNLPPGTAGPQFYPLHGPVTARLPVSPLPASGAAAAAPAATGGSGGPLSRYGRVFTSAVSPYQPAVTPGLPQPAGVRVVFLRAGHIQRSLVYPPIPPGVPQPTVPVVEYRPPVRVPRGLRGGLAGSAPPFIPVVTAYRRPPVQVKRPAPHRACLGPRGALAGGVASRIVTPVPPVVTAYQRIAPQIRRPAPARAWVGHGSTAGGIASYILRALGTPQPTVPVVEYRPPPPRRVLWYGAAGPAAPPPIPVTAYQRIAPQIRRPTPARAIWHGLAVAKPPVLGAPQPTVPIVEYRPPPPARAHTGPRPVHGPTNLPPAPPVVTAYQRPAPQVKRPSPARAQVGPRGQIAAGIASAIVTPLGSLPVLHRPLPPQAIRPAPHRVLWRGFASRVVTPPPPLGTPQPTVPIIRFQSPPARGVTIPHGITGPVNLPPPPPAAVPPPVTVLAAPAAPMTIVINPAAPMTIDVVFAPPMGVDVTPPGRIAPAAPAHIDPPGQQLITQQPAVLLRPA